MLLHDSNLEIRIASSLWSPALKLWKINKVYSVLQKSVEEALVLYSPGRPLFFQLAGFFTHLLSSVFVLLISLSKVSSRVLSNNTVKVWLNSRWSVVARVQTTRGNFS